MPQQLITIGQIIDHAWDHYRKHFVELISVSSWLLIVAVLYTVAFAFYPSETTITTGQELTLIERLSYYLTLITSLIVVPIIGHWVFIGLTRLTHRQKQEKKTNLRDLAKSNWKSFLPLVLVNILYALLLFATLAFLVPGLGLIILSEVASITFIGSLGTILLILGMFLILILVLWWSVRYFFVGYTLLIDDQHGRSAFTASRKAVGSNFWPVFWRILIPKVLYFFIFASIQFVLGSLLYMLVAGFSGLNLELTARLITISSVFLAVGLSIFMNPLVIITDYLIYQSAKSK
ncbi:MAG: hypothetical protein ABIH67_02195 [Candidatus Uhrbacteria bacterium]